MQPSIWSIISPRSSFAMSRSLFCRYSSTSSPIEVLLRSLNFLYCPFLSLTERKRGRFNHHQQEEFGARGKKFPRFLILNNRFLQPCHCNLDDKGYLVVSGPTARRRMPGRKS